MLLKNGAGVNFRADHRTCLQIMYWSKFRPENFVLCSEIFVRYAMDVNAMDHNNNTALDYLAWELGQKWYQISKGRVIWFWYQFVQILNSLKVFYHTGV